MTHFTTACIITLTLEEYKLFVFIYFCCTERGTHRHVTGTAPPINSFHIKIQAIFFVDSLLSMKDHT